MDVLWTPWRYRYVASATKDEGCVFCDAAASKDDARLLVVWRGKKNFIILNRYPYTSGHSMVVPYAHQSELKALDSETLSEMMLLVQRVQIAFEALYHPDGYNLGMNLGKAAGAGIASHLHMHILPRWIGDTNFMTTVGETRLEPEDLATTYERLHKALS
jgi:ATP adenylyltransferase